MFQYEDKFGEPIPESLLPKGADWSDATPEEVQRCLENPDEMIRLGWVLALGPDGINVADIALEGDLGERLRNQNARLSEFDYPED